MKEKSVSELASQIALAESARKERSKLMSKYRWLVSDKGKQYEAASSLPQETLESLEQDLKLFIDSIPAEDICRCVLVVRNSLDTKFHINAIKMVVKEWYTILLEEVPGDNDENLAVRVIINLESEYERLTKFFGDFGIEVTEPEVVKEIISRVDLHGGIDIVQYTWTKFCSSYPTRKDYFNLNEDILGLYEVDNTLILTSLKWSKQVYLILPKGEWPWNYRATLENGLRTKAVMRYNLYGKTRYKK